MIKMHFYKRGSVLCLHLSHRLLYGQSITTRLHQPGHQRLAHRLRPVWLATSVVQKS